MGTYIVAVYEHTVGNPTSDELEGYAIYNSTGLEILLPINTQAVRNLETTIILYTIETIESRPQNYWIDKRKFEQFLDYLHDRIQEDPKHNVSIRLEEWGDAEYKFLEEMSDKLCKAGAPNFDYETIVTEFVEKYYRQWKREGNTLTA